MGVPGTGQQRAARQPDAQDLARRAQHGAAAETQEMVLDARDRAFALFKYVPAWHLRQREDGCLSGMSSRKQMSPSAVVAASAGIRASSSIVKGT